MFSQICSWSSTASTLKRLTFSTIGLIKPSAHTVASYSQLQLQLVMNGGSIVLYSTRSYILATSEKR